MIDQTDQTEQMERLVTLADTQEVTSMVRTPVLIAGADVAFSTLRASCPDYERMRKP